MDESRWQLAIDDSGFRLHDGTGVNGDASTAARQVVLDGADKYAIYQTRDYLNALEQAKADAEHENAILRDAMDADPYMPIDVLARRHKARLAKAQRYREALERIADHCKSKLEDGTSNPDWAWDHIAVADYARAALADVAETGA